MEIKFIPRAWSTSLGTWLWYWDISKEHDNGYVEVVARSNEDKPHSIAVKELSEALLKEASTMTPYMS